MAPLCPRRGGGRPGRLRLGRRRSSDGSSGSTGSSGPVTITWWHNSNNEPGKGYYEQVAKDFEADHPGVTIEISAMAARGHGRPSSTRRSRAATSPTSTWSAAAASSPTTSRRAWSATSPRRPRTRSTRSAAPSPAGRSTARPTRCRSRSASSASGTTRSSSSRPASPSPPTTMDELVRRHRQAQGRGHRRRSRSVPATSGRPRTTGTTRALRSCPQDVLKDAVKQPRLLRPVLRQGRRGPRGPARDRAVQRGLPDHPGAGGGRPPPPVCWPPARSPWRCRATGSPASCRASPTTARASATRPAGSRSRRSTAAQGDPSAALGGGDAWAVSEDAPDEAVDFVKYLLSDEVQKGFAENDMGLPTNSGRQRLRLGPGPGRPAQGP